MPKFKAGDVVEYVDCATLMEILYVGKERYFVSNSVGAESAPEIKWFDEYFRIKKERVKLYRYRYFVAGSWYSTGKYYDSEDKFKTEHPTVKKYHRIEESAWEPEE